MSRRGAPGALPGAGTLQTSELLRGLAEEGNLEGALARVPELEADEARRLLLRLADRLKREAAGEPQGDLFAAPATAPPRSPPADRPAVPSSPPSPTASPSGAAGLRRVRMYCDGAARGNPGPAGAGAVVTDEAGNVLMEVGRYLGRQTNNVAEYEGLLLGLRTALRLGAREIEVRADSELLVRQLTGRYKVKAPHLKPLYDEAVELLSRFERHQIRHVFRADNAAADEMSNRAIDERLAD